MQEVKETIRAINRRIKKCYRNATPQQKHLFAAQIVHGMRKKVEPVIYQAITNTLVDQYSARYRYFDNKRFREIVKYGV